MVHRGYLPTTYGMEGTDIDIDIGAQTRWSRLYRIELFIRAEIEELWCCQQFNVKVPTELS